MIYERECLGVKIKYDGDTGRMWRWIECQSWDGPGYPRWLETGLSQNSKNARSVWLVGKSYLIHRVARFVVTGAWPENTIDHINRDRGNNTWKNLRDVTYGVNNQNRGLHGSNTSGVAGVCKVGAKYRARISSQGKVFHLGTFDSLAEAKLVRQNAQFTFGYHPNHGINICA